VSGLSKKLISMVAVLAVLAAAGVLAALTTTLNGAEVFALLTVIAGGTAVSGGLALGGTTGANLVPHIVLITAVLGLTVALAILKIFDSGEVTGVFGFILGGGAVGAGSSVTSAQDAAVTTSTSTSMSNAVAPASNAPLPILIPDARPVSTTSQVTGSSQTAPPVTMTPPVVITTPPPLTTTPPAVIPPDEPKG